MLRSSSVFPSSAAKCKSEKQMGQSCCSSRGFTGGWGWGGVPECHHAKHSGTFCTVLVLLASFDMEACLWDVQDLASFVLLGCRAKGRPSSGHLQLLHAMRIWCPAGCNTLQHCTPRCVARIRPMGLGCGRCSAPPSRIAETCRAETGSASVRMRARVGKAPQGLGDAL